MNFDYAGVLVDVVLMGQGEEEPGHRIMVLIYCQDDLH